MRITELFASDSPVYVTAPMINQSDLAFRVLTRQYGATLTYTQMLHPDKLMYNQDYLEHHILNMDPPGTLDLADPDAGNGDLGLGKPVVAQVCGNDVQKIVEACKKIVGHCDAIGPSLASKVFDMLRIRGTDKLVRFELGMPSHIRSG
jgi:tRNA-dihydrouridine synthase 1